MTMITRKLSNTQAQLVFPLLEALQEAGGEAPASEVYERVADKVGLTEEERRALIPGLAGRYRCFDRDVRWAKLVNRQHVQQRHRPSGRGTAAALGRD